MGDIKEILGHLKGIINASVFNLMLLFGFLLVLGSFLGFDGLEHISFLEETRPHVYKLALENITDRELDLDLQYTYGETVVIRFTRHGFR